MPLSRRTFLKLSGLAAAGASLPAPFITPRARAGYTNPWPQGEHLRLGRMTWPWGVGVFSRPTHLGKELRKLGSDEVVPILRDVVGLGLAFHNHVWFELEDGYVYSSYLQPVKNIINTPLTTLPPDGVFAELSVPYVDALARPDPTAPIVYRLYYSCVFKITEVVTAADGALWYRAYSETETRMYVPAETFRIIQPDEIAPISPDIDPGDKRLVVHLDQQYLTAYERKAEVFRTRIASGALYFGENGHTVTSGTPTGPHPIWQKRISRHMQGETYDVPGVGWVSYFGSNGAALHSTYWHNDYGTPKSHGCLNCRPEDSKWIFRWTMPHTPYDPGDITVDWETRGTTVDIRVEG